jgi:LPXTG-motif cell wall-anchored protein
VTSDLTVTAVYAINEYTLTYKITGAYFTDPEHAVVTFRFGAPVNAIPIPSQPGYTFHGWEGVPDTMPAEDVIVTGYYTRDYVAPDPEPDMTVTKDGKYVDVNGNDYLNVGDRIDYTITVTNTGDVVLTDIRVVDPLIGLDLLIDQLGVGEIWEHLGSYDITGDDIDAEKVINTVTVTANELGDPVITTEETPLDGEVEEVVAGEEEEEEDPKEPEDPEVPDVPVTGEALAWQYPALGALLMALGAVVLVLRRKEHA